MFLRVYVYVKLYHGYTTFKYIGTVNYKTYLQHAHTPYIYIYIYMTSVWQKGETNNITVRKYVQGFNSIMIIYIEIRTG